MKANTNDQEVPLSDSDDDVNAVAEDDYVSSEEEDNDAFSL